MHVTSDVVPACDAAAERALGRLARSVDSGCALQGLRPDERRHLVHQLDGAAGPPALCERAAAASCPNLPRQRRRRPSPIESGIVRVVTTARLHCTCHAKCADDQPRRDPASSLQNLPAVEAAAQSCRNCDDPRSDRPSGKVGARTGVIVGHGTTHERNPAAGCSSLRSRPGGCASPACADSAIDAKAQVEFGILVAQKGLWKEAALRWERATEIDPTYAAAWNNLGIGYEQLGRFDEARKAYEKALELDPDNTYIQTNYDLFREIYDRQNRRRGR